MDCGETWMVDKVWKNIRYMFLSLFFWIQMFLGRGVIFVDNGIDEWPVLETNTDICINSLLSLDEVGVTVLFPSKRRFWTKRLRSGY
jgi:hypothetical protein